jgi:ribonuclease P protein subunit POP4
MKTYKEELIGSTVEVVGSKNQTLIGLKGKIIEETKNTLTIQGESKKKLLKSHITLKIDGQIIEGKSLQKRPEDRIKK